METGHSSCVMITVCPLQVGSTVEVKTNEGLSSEAVIGKLTDASLYTVGESLSADWATHAATSSSNSPVMETE